MKGPVLVVGATGNVSGATVQALQQQGIPGRSAVTDPGRVRRRGVEPVELDVFRPETFAAAVRGIRGVLAAATAGLESGATRPTP